MSSTPRLAVQILGRFVVRRNAEEVPPSAFGGRLARRLVCLLLTRQGETVPRDALIEALWPERRPSDPAANLNVLVNRARRALGEPSPIETAPGGYSFVQADWCEVDADALVAAATDATGALARGHAADALRAAEDGLARWGGPPLVEDRYAGWAQPFIDRLATAHQQLLEVGAEAALSVGEHRRAIALAEQAVGDQPLREPAHLLLVRARAAGGDRAGALAAYDTLRRVLAEELGLDPSEEARRLQERLLRGDWPHDRSSDGPAGQARPLPSSGLSHGPVPLAFVGRDTELATALGALSAAGRATVVVEGQSGMGKSRFLAEVARRLREPALTVRAFPAENDEPWSLARSLLREVLALDVSAVEALPDRAAGALAGLLPELEDLGAAGRLQTDAATARALVLEGAIALLRGVCDRGAVLLVDDLQWADATSLTWLGMAIARLHGVRPVLAYRPEEVRDGSPLERFLTDLAASTPVMRIPLALLPETALGRLVADPTVEEVLRRDTDRSAFAVAETIRELAGQGVLVAGRDGRWTARERVPLDRARVAASTGDRRAVAARLARHPARTRRLASVLALFGRETPARLLAAATGQQQPTVLEDLDRLSMSGLVRLGDHGWSPAHERVGAIVVDELDPARRGRLHQLVADGLRRAGADLAEVAHHLAAAGDRDAAADAYAEVARQRLDHSATEEAGRLAEAGLELAPGDEIRSILLEVRAAARARRGDRSGAHADLQEAIRLVRTRPVRARLLCRQAMLASGAEDLTRAAELADLAIAAAGGDREARARALATAAIVDMNLERRARADTRSSEALALFEQAGDAHGIAEVLDARAMATFLSGRIHEGIEAFERVATLFVDVGDLIRAVTPRSTRGHGLVFAGRPEEGLSDTDAALELATSLGLPEGRTYVLWHRSEACTALDRLDEALDNAREALAIAEDLDHRGWRATARRALAIALRAAGDLPAAEATLRSALRDTRNLPLFASWVHAQLALVLIAAGRLDQAERHVASALAHGPPLGRFEARLARVELAVARRDPAAADLARAALEPARTLGHHASATRLIELVDDQPAR